MEDWWNKTPYKSMSAQKQKTAQERLASVETAIGMLINIVEKADNERKKDIDNLRKHIDDVADKNNAAIDKLAESNRRCFKSLEDSIEDIRAEGVKHARAIDVITVKIGVICTGLGSAIGWVVNYIADKLK